MKSTTIFFFILAGCPFFGSACFHELSIDPEQARQEDIFVAQHLKKTADGYFICTFCYQNGLCCGKIDRGKRKARNHIRAHGSYNSVKCSCGRIFKTAGGHARHKRNEEKGIDLQNALVPTKPAEKHFPHIPAIQKDGSVPQDDLEDEKLPEDLKGIELSPLFFTHDPFFPTTATDPCYGPILPPTNELDSI